VIRPTYAVVPTSGRDCTARSLESIRDQVTETIVVWNGGVPAMHTIVGGCCPRTVLRAPGPGRNISAWWNLGIAQATVRAAQAGAPEWNVLVMNDDVIACPQLVETLDWEMRGCTAVLAYPNAFDDRRVLLTEPDADTSTRITGWCFMLRGEAGLTADVRLVWWYGDNMIDWQARERGGSLCVPGCKVEHLHPGKLTGESAELSAQTHRDRDVFLGLWNNLPH